MSRRKPLRILCRAVAAATIPLMMGACIDEDLSKCGVEYAVEYQMRLSTALQATMDAEFVTTQEQEIAQLLRSGMQDLLHDRAATMDLSFFTYPEDELASHQSLSPNANSLSMTVYLDQGDYRNLAVATTAREVPQVSIEDAASYADASLMQAAQDTVDAHAAAVYMGRLPQMTQGNTGKYVVPLYMQNAVPVLLIDLNGTRVEPIGCYVRRMACGLRCADSTFLFTRQSVMRTHRVSTDTHVSYYSACFPSARQATSTLAADNEEAEGSLWEIDLYTRTAEGDYTKNTLYVKKPLLAGGMVVVKVKLEDGGEVTSVNADVGVSVELDWKPGGDYEIEI